MALSDKFRKSIKKHISDGAAVGEIGRTNSAIVLRVAPGYISSCRMLWAEREYSNPSPVVLLSLTEALT